MDSPSSSRHKDNDDYKRHGKKHKRKYRSRSRSRNRSRSRSYSPKKSTYYWNGKTVGEYELRIQALSTQLAMANSQLLTAETALVTVKNLKNQSDQKILQMQQENQSLFKRNAEIIEVMKTLEAGVEALQKEKVQLESRNGELKTRIEILERNESLMNEQIESLTNRNSTLSKKCVDLLETGKESKEKCAQYEFDLGQLKPFCDTLQKQSEELMQENKKLAKQIEGFKLQENEWGQVKGDLEKRLREQSDRVQRVEQYVNQRLATAIEEMFKRSVDKKGEHVFFECLKKLQLTFDSIRSMHRTQLQRMKDKLEALEKEFKEIVREKNPMNHSSLNSEEGLPV